MGGILRRQNSEDEFPEVIHHLFSLMSSMTVLQKLNLPDSKTSPNYSSHQLSLCFALDYASVPCGPLTVPRGGWECLLLTASRLSARYQGGNPKKSLSKNSAEDIFPYVPGQKFDCFRLNIYVNHPFQVDFICDIR